MDFGVYLVRRGLITADDYVDVREEQLNARRKLGELALSTHKLSMRQVMAILEAQLDSPKPFGQLAIDKGYLTRSEVLELLGLQIELCPSILDLLIDRMILDKETLRQETQRFRGEVVTESMVDQES
jgi:hypothetical protein